MNSSSGHQISDNNSQVQYWRSDNNHRDLLSHRDSLQEKIMKTLLLAILLGGCALGAKVDPIEGLWQGYDGEWGHVSRQLVA